MNFLMLCVRAGDPHSDPLQGMGVRPRSARERILDASHRDQDHGRRVLYEATEVRTDHLSGSRLELREGIEMRPYGVYSQHNRSRWAFWELGHLP